jgi:CRP-like cAMP-binding protein
MSTQQPGPRDEPGRPADDGPPGLAELTGDEAVLPAGSRLADEARAGHQCFLILQGTATVERDGTALRRLGNGAFVGELGPDQRPLPPSGVTVRLDTRSRVLVLDPARLAVAIDADPALAAAWRSLITGT